MPFGTSVFGIYKDLYERDFKFVRRHEERVALFETGTADGPFIEAAFGGFPASGPLEPFVKAYVDAFDAIRLPPSADNWVKVITEQFRLPLHFTRQGIKRDPDGWSEPTLFVVDPASACDLIDLWNIRQFHPQILPVNFSWFHEVKEFIAEFVKANFRPLPGNPHGLMIRTTIQFGRSISKERAEAVVSEAGLIGLPDLPWAFKLLYDRIWRPDRSDWVVQPHRARISAATNDLEVTVSDEGPERACRFVSLAPEFAGTYGDNNARWVNVLKFRKYGRNDTFALSLPTSFTNQQGRGLRTR